MPTFGPYELIRRLGVGGMGEAFLARLTRQNTFEKLVVIKRLLPQFSRDEAFQSLFRHEAKLAALLSHQNIVQIFDFGQVDGQLFICMEFVEGLDTAALISHNALPIPIALTILIEAARGLDYAHRKTQPDGSPLGLVHRDVTTRNLLVSLEGEVKWIDFGLARALKRDGRDSLVAGTLAYMSPEQAEGRALDARSDLFSLGVVAYELFTGLRPWAVAARASDHAQQCVVNPVRAPLSHRPELGDALDQIILKLLAPHPADRFQTARNLLDALSAPALPTPAPPQHLSDLVRSLSASLPAPNQPATDTNLNLPNPPATHGLITAPASKPLGVIAPPPETPPTPTTPPRPLPAKQDKQDKQKTQQTPPLGLDVLDALDAATSSPASSATPTMPVVALPPEMEARLVLGKTDNTSSANNAAPKRAPKGKQLAPLTPLRPPPVMLSNQANTASSFWDGKALWLVMGVLLGVIGIVLGVMFALKQGIRGEASEITPPSAPPPTTPEVAALWSLSVQSQPSGARVWLDADEIGTTPLIYGNLLGPRQARLHIEAPDHEPHTETLTFGTEGGMIERSPDLIPKPALLRLNVTPPDAQLEITAGEGGAVLLEKRAAPTKDDPPLSLKSQDVWLVVSHARFAPWRQRVNLSPGRLTTLNVTLDVSLAQVQFQSSQDGLRALLSAGDGSGAALGQCHVPCALSGLMPGQYVVVIEDTTDSGRPSVTTRLLLAAGSNVSLPVRLSSASSVPSVGSSSRKGVRLSALGGQLQRDGKPLKSAIFGDSGGVLELLGDNSFNATIRIDPAAEGSDARYLLSVRSRPWARFQVNGRSFDQLTYFPLPGEYDIKLLPEGKAPASGVLGFKLGVANKPPR